jgi:hypothetical protein
LVRFWCFLFNAVSFLPLIWILGRLTKRQHPPQQTSKLWALLAEGFLDTLGDVPEARRCLDAGREAALRSHDPDDLGVTGAERVLLLRVLLGHGDPPGPTLPQGVGWRLARRTPR